MFEKITMWMRRLWWRVSGRQTRPVLFRQRVYGGGATEGGRRPAAGRQADNNGPFNGLDPAGAADEIFAPRHGEEESFRFAGVGPDGTVPHHGEIWDRQNNSLRVRRQRVMLITCSRGVVPSAEEIRVVCSECGGVDSVGYRCARCGVALCQLHAHVLQHPDGPVLYCREHLEEALDAWDTWAAYDAQQGKPAAKSALPGRPWAPAKYAPPGGGHHG